MKHATFVSIETTAFSGATLLALALGGHPRIVTVGELSGLLPRNDPGRYLCSCGEIINTCGFWKAVQSGMKRRGHRLDLQDFDTQFRIGGPRLVQKLCEGSSRVSLVDSIRDRILLGLPGPSRQLQDMTNRNVALIEAILEASGKDILVDSSKSRMRASMLRSLSDLDVRIVHLVRGVEGVVSSHLRRGRKEGVTRLARDWARRHRRIEVNLKVWPREKQTRVRYEDLCLRPEETLPRLLTFCGVEGAMERLVPDEGQHVIGNPMRLKRWTGFALDERWRDELTEEQLLEIDRVAGRVRRRLGYTDQERRRSGLTRPPSVV